MKATNKFFILSSVIFFECLNRRGQTQCKYFKFVKEKLVYSESLNRLNVAKKKIRIEHDGSDN